MSQQKQFVNFRFEVFQAFKPEFFQVAFSTA